MPTSDHHRFPIVRVEDDDPKRCQAVISTRGQCFLKAVEGSQYCPCHGGNNQAKKNDKVNMFKYRLAQHQTRLDAHTDSDNIKNLRDEIAILRMLVQKRLEAAGNDILIHSGPLSVLILKINSLSQSCAKVELSLSDVMEKNDVLLLAHNIIMACRKYAPDTLDQLIEDVTHALDRLHFSESGSLPSNYKLAKWGEELSSYLSQERIVSVRGEIGVLRLLVEEKLNKCKDVHDLMSESNPISNLISDIEKLIVSCHKLEVSTGLLVEKEVAMEFSQELITIVGNHITDSDALLEIAQCV